MANSSEHFYSRLNLSLLAHARRMNKARIKRDITSGQRVPKPVPLRKIPRRTIRKYFAGTR
jgi:hypothetical protein